MKTVDRYHQWVEWSEEDQTYIGKCPDLMTGIHGDDPAALYHQLRETVRDIIDHFEQNQRDLPLPKTRPMMEVA